MGKRGRPPKPGSVYYLGRLRFRPGVDPPALQDFLEALEDAEPARRRAMLREALVGGVAEGLARGTAVEDEETTELIDDLLADF